jgi:soluble cytochrome b562
MKIFLALLLCAAPLLFADDEQPTLVALQMDQIADGFKSLKKQASDAAQKDSSLALVSSMKQAVSTARTGIPEPAEKLTGAPEEEYMATFRKGLDELDAALQKLDAAIRAGDAGTIDSTLNGINSLKKTYHSDLR